MEEIDIIELLQRVKEGNAPKRIEIKGVIYERNTDEQFQDYVDLMYQHYRGVDEPIDWWIDDKDVTLDTKIKILDKPKIKELKPIDDGYVSRAPDNFEIMSKINEIIDYINNKENKDV